MVAVAMLLPRGQSREEGGRQVGFTPNGSTVVATIARRERQKKRLMEKPAPNGMLVVRDLARVLLGHCAWTRGASLFAGTRSYDAQADPA